MILVAGFAGFLLLDSPWGAIALVGAMVIEVGETWAWIQFLKRYRVRTGVEGLIGERAEVIEPCRPRGRVKLRGEIWRAHCPDQGAEVGERVRITAVEGLELEVTRLAAGTET